MGRLRSNFTDVKTKMVTWLVLVLLMLGLNGGSSSKVDVNLQGNGGPHQSRVLPEFKCPEYNTFIAGNGLGWIVGIPDWRTCGWICTTNSECTYWKYKEDAKGCYLVTGDLIIDYDPNNPDWVSGEHGCHQ